MKVVYSSKNNAVVSEIHKSELVRFATFINSVISEKSEISTYESETKEFRVQLKGNADIYEATVAVDLYTMTPEKLETGTGEAEISLYFKCTRSEITDFAAQITRWLN